MGVGARGAWAALILGALLVLALLKAAVDGSGPEGSPNTQNLVPSGNHSANPTENVTAVTSNHTSQPTSTVRQPTTPQSSASKTETVTATPRITTPAASANRTNSSSVSQNTTQTTPATVTSTAHNSSATSTSSSVTITPTINSKGNPGSKFDIGSFLGGIVLTLGVLSILYIGCRTYYSRRGIRYRTIDEHDAII
ncbi:porimin [Mirounga leonina]|uniref:porimin n=1 Tax=Mirounga leonina TaxID=9715 RepID=UPI00156BFDD7|nr:porimin [Mirounga leonina]XP_045751125.1 porimin [Mirounga angustirostris]